MAGSREAGVSTGHALPLERVLVWAGAGAVGLIAAAVRLGGALHFALWQDEVASARVIVERSPISMVRQVVSSESTPPGWYTLGWVAHRLGTAPQGARLFSVAAGAILAAGLVAYARQLVPLWAATLAGFAAALGYQFVFHGRELRAYELLALLNVALAVAVQRAVAAPERRRLVALALVVTAGAFIHYFFLLSLVATGAWLLASRAPAPARRSAARAMAVGLLPFTAWLPFLVLQLQHHLFSFIGAFDGDDVLATYWLLFARAQPQMVVLDDAAPLLLFAAVIAGSVVLARQSDVGRLCAVLGVLPLLLAALLWLLGLRIFDVRNLIGTGPFAAVALAGLIARLRAPAAIPAACFCVLALVWGYARAERAPPVAYDQVAKALVAEGWRPTDPILVYGNVYALKAPLEWYLPGRPALRLVNSTDGRSAPTFVVGSGGELTRSRLAPEAAAIRYAGRTIVARLDTALPPRRADVLLAGAETKP